MIPKIGDKKEAYKGKWLEFVNVHFSLRGKEKVWEVIQRPDPTLGGAKIVAFCNQKGVSKILVTLNYRLPVENYVLEFPSGMRDKGETYTESAIRELLEETGYHCKNAKLLDLPTYSDPWKSSEVGRYVFASIDMDDKSNINPKSKLEPEESISALFFTTDNLIQEVLDFASKKGCLIDSQLYAFAAGLELKKKLEVYMKK